MGRKLRIGVRSASTLIVAASMFAQTRGAGILIVVPGILRLLIFLAAAWLTVDLAAFSIASKSWRTRVPLCAITVVSAAITIALGCMALIFPRVPCQVLGEVPTGLGRRTTACLVSVPLVTDFVVIERRVYLLPGVYVYKIIETFDPAWDARFQYTGGAILVSYYGNEHKLHQEQLRP